MSKFDLVPLLAFIDPDYSYERWIQVGMALQKEGYPVSVWDAWSRKGSKYHDGECVKKWQSFHEDREQPVTGAVITQWAKEGGWKPSGRHEGPVRTVTGFTFTDSDFLIDPSTVEPEDFHEPSDGEWDPKGDLISYLQALFKPDEYVGLAVNSFLAKDGKWKPVDNGQCKRTCGEIVEALQHSQQISSAVGSLQNEAAGAWIRINPLDGEGAKNANVTDFRYALVESDTLPLGQQLALIRQMQLPCAAIVYSGGKSVHAIVHVDAATQKEYYERVAHIYDICNKNGFKVDTQNKNPSRLSRMPGVTRNGKKQFLIGVNQGQKDYLAWLAWTEEQQDDLPPFLPLNTVIDDPPPLNPVLIDGILRLGHKAILTGPSKAGKSFWLMQLALAIASGGEFLGWKCRQGKVLYINLEIDEKSFIDRLEHIYRAKGMPMHPSSNNLIVWDLRGKALPMDKLAKIIVRRCKEMHLEAIIVDPIYKVITGDENAASDMAYFGNQFDYICRELGCSVIYCHHHSKGAQGAKRATDRGSGSGVFSRDADAIIDLTAIELKEEEKDQYGCDVAYCCTCILREFKTPKPKAILFQYPLHTLAPDIDPKRTEGSIEGNRVKGNITQTQNKNDRYEEFIRTLEHHLANGDVVNQNNLADEMQVSVRTVQRYLQQANEPIQVYENITGRNGRIRRLDECR